MMRRMMPVALAILVGMLSLAHTQPIEYPIVAADADCTIPSVPFQDSIQSGLFTGVSYLADSGARDMNVSKECLNFAGRLAVQCQVDARKEAGCCQPSCAQLMVAAVANVTSALCVEEVVTGFCRAQRNQTNVPPGQLAGVQAVFLSTNSVFKRCATGKDYDCNVLLAPRPPPLSAQPPPLPAVAALPGPTRVSSTPATRKPNLGLIIGASVGGVAAVLAVALIVFVVLKTKSRSGVREASQPEGKDTLGAAHDGGEGPQTGGAGSGNASGWDGFVKVETGTDRSGCAAPGFGPGTLNTAVHSTGTAYSTTHMNAVYSEHPATTEEGVTGSSAQATGDRTTNRPRQGHPKVYIPGSEAGADYSTLVTPASLHSRGAGQAFTTRSTGATSRGAPVSPSSQVTVGSGQTDTSAFQKELLSRMQITWDEIVLGRAVGRGGFGTVYKGVWQGNSVAVKMLDVEKLTNDSRESLRQEALAMSEIRHPSIATVYGLADDGLRCALVMKFYEGGSLFSAITKAKYMEMPLYKRLRLALQIASGMQRLHQRNILHGDLKTANILLEKDSTVVITDFGLSVMEGQSVTSGALTVQISPPEVLLDPRAPRTQAGDVYAFAIVLLETVTGRPVYGGATRAMIKRAVLDGQRPTIPVTLPAEVVEIITQCWAQQAGDRPTFVQVVSRLTALTLPRSKSGRDEHQGTHGIAWPTTAMATDQTTTTAFF